MPTILDELVVKLGLDSSGFRRDASSAQAAVVQVGTAARREGRALEEVLGKTQAATSARMKQVEAVGRSAAQGFTRLRNEVVGLLATIAGAYGIEQFVRSVARTDAAMGYAAKSIGIGVSELSAWDEMGKRVGGNAGDVTAAMKGFSQEVQKFGLHGQTSMMPVMRQLAAMPGAFLKIAELTGEATRTDEVFLALADRFSRMPLPRALAMGADIGLNETTIRLLAMGREALIKMREEQKRLGVVTDEDVNASVRFNNSLASLEQVLTRLGNSIFTDLEKPITSAIQAMTNLVIEFRNTPGAIAAVEDKIRMFGTALKEIGVWIKAVVDYLGGWKNTTELIFGLWVATKVAPIITMVASLAAAMGTLAAATAAVDTAAGGAGIKFLLGGAALAGGSYGINTLLEKLEEHVYGKEFVDKEKSFRDKHSPIRDWFYKQMGWASGEGESHGGASDERKASVRDQLAGKLGISGAAASGIVVGLNAESGIRGINEVGGTPGGIGWPQWTDTQGSPRRTSFLNFAKARGLDPASDEANMEYLVAELKARYPNVLAQLRRGDISATEAANVFTRGYIVPPEHTIPGHVAGAEAVAKLPSTVPKVGETFGPQQLPPPSTAPGVLATPTYGPFSAIDPGMRYAMRPAGASQVDNSRSSTSSVETHINGPINVQTSATDADGIAKGIGASLKKYAFVSQANYGLA